VTPLNGNAVRDYIAQMQKLAKRIPALDDGLLLKGLRSHIKASVVQQKADIRSAADILELAKLAEAVTMGNEDDTADASRRSPSRSGRGATINGSSRRMSVSSTLQHQNVVSRECPSKSQIQAYRCYGTAALSLTSEADAVDSTTRVKASGQPFWDRYADVDCARPLWSLSRY